MADFDTVRTLVLALPSAVDADDHGKPAAAVGGKLFCVFNRNSARLTVKLDPEDQRNLCDGYTSIVTAVDGYWGRKGWTHVDYASADDALLSTLVTLAWTTVAPKRLRGTLKSEA